MSATRKKARVTDDVRIVRFEIGDAWCVSFADGVWGIRKQGENGVYRFRTLDAAFDARPDCPRRVRRSVIRQVRAMSEVLSPRRKAGKRSRG